jgi:uncharacterized protein (DUF2062 family)
MLHDHRLWGIRRKNVVPSFSLGLFVACMPFPGHYLLSALAALALRINIPVAVLTTFLSNPITMGPIYYFCYKVGAFLLSVPERPFEFEMTLDWLGSTFVSIWEPMLLGCVLVGAVAALVGYVSLDAFWRYSIRDYKARKRRLRKHD